LLNRTVLIANPAAGQGRARTRLHEARAAFAAIGAGIRETNAAGDEEQLARAAIADGADTIVVAGGDGTCSRVATAIIESGTRCRMGVIACGTGNDFAKTLGLTRMSPTDLAGLLARNTHSAIDVGRASNHYFINTCGFGFDPAVLEATQRVKFLKGDSVYIYAALRQLFTYRAARMEVEGSERMSGESLMAIVSNGSHLGGAFHVAPGASVKDGKLDLTVFCNAGFFLRGLMFARALRGTHLKMDVVATAQYADLVLHFAEPPMMEVDGELRKAGSSAVRVECLPKALWVVAAPGFPR
jgi:diacylglycerol kinase (ATP)